MIPDLALIVAAYAMARLLNGIAERHPSRLGFTILVWTVNLLAFLFIGVMAVDILLSGTTIPAT